MIIETVTTLAFIPGLCPLDDIIIWLFFPALGVWLLKKFKWCKKSCDCDCHETKVNPKYKCKDCGQDYKDHVPGPMGGVECPQVKPKIKRVWFKLP